MAGSTGAPGALNGTMAATKAAPQARSSAATSSNTTTSTTAQPSSSTTTSANNGTSTTTAPSGPASQAAAKNAQPTSSGGGAFTGISGSSTVVVNFGQVTFAPLPAGGSTGTVGAHFAPSNMFGSTFVPGGGTTVIGGAGGLKH
jgi:hypothetical protein